MAIIPQGSFIFDANTSSPQELARKRAIIAQIMGSRNAPKTIGEGLNAIGDGIVANVLGRRADAAESAGMESASEAFNPILEAFTSRMNGDGGFPAAPDGSVPLPEADIPSSRVSQAHGDTQKATGFSGSQQEFVDMLMPSALEASQRTGVDPRIIVAQAAQETGWGKSAPGNNFFGIKSHGKGGGQNLKTHEYVNGQRVNVSDSFRTFGSPEESVAGYADFIQQNPRYRPFMAAEGLDAQLDALQASGYATDPNYSRSVGRIARGIAMPDPQVASANPSAGTATAANEAMATGGLSNGLTPEMLQQWAATNYSPAAPQPAGVGETAARLQPSPSAAPAPAMPAPQTVQDRPVAPMQTAQGGGLPEMAGQAPRAVPAQGPDLSMLMQAAQNPWLSDQQRAMVNMLLEQQMQQNDPMRQLDMDYKRAQIGKMQRDAAGGDTTYGLNPIYGKDAQGNTVLGVLGNDGTFKPVDTGGVSVSTGVDRVDLGTHYGLLDKRSGQVVGTLPKEVEEEAAAKARGGAAGKAEGEAVASYRSMTSKMPGLEQVVNRLEELSETATYTLAGRGLDEGMRQLGMEPREEAVARAEYTAIIDNQILPLLRDTFGAQFTAAEGERLSRTLGDPNKSPTEKQALLRAFIEQKRRDIEALALQSMQDVPSSAPAEIDGYTIEQVD